MALTQKEQTTLDIMTHWVTGKLSTYEANNELAKLDNETKLQKVIRLIQRVDDNCQAARYSLDDVRYLALVIEVLKRERQYICECCT